MKNNMTKNAAKAALDDENSKLPKEQINTNKYTPEESLLVVRYQIRPAENPNRTELASSNGSEKKDANLLDMACVSKVQDNP
jgi:hypothetical protein